MTDKNPFEDTPVIYSYTRAQAIEDGFLMDLTWRAKEAGFRIPVACTAIVWDGYIVPAGGTRELGQSERGRADDLLWTLYLYISQSKSIRQDQFRFEVIFEMAPKRHEKVTLKAMCGPGDNGEPVLTVMLPNED